MSGRALRAVLRLAPRPFRERYGDELLDASASRVAAARRGGWLRSLRVQLKELVGVVALVVRLRARPLRTHFAVARPGRSHDGIVRDVRFALRTLRREPTYAITGVLVLGIGIGASVAIFSAANAFLLRPLPFGDADRLVMLYETNPEFGWTDQVAAPANLLDWRERVDAFDDVAGFSMWVDHYTMVADGEPVLLAATSVTGNFFSTLGVRALHGRTLTFEETWDGSDDVVVLSHALWRRHFGSDPGVVGRTLELTTGRLRIVGVMPEGFSYPSAQTEMWVPWGWTAANRDEVWFRRAHFVAPIARLAPGVTYEAAAADLERVVQQLQREYPETNSVMGAGLMPLRRFLVRDVRRTLVVLLGAVGLLLLLACANVANLTLVRGSARTRELALRHALGAGRARVIRQLLTESLVLAVGGGALGIAAGWAGVRALESMTTLGIEGATSIALDLRVVLFALATTMLSALLFGLVPAVRSTATGVHGAIIDGGTGASAGRTRLRTVRALVMAEVALAVLLVMAAGLMTRSVLLMRSVDPGFRMDGIVAVSFYIPPARYEDRDAVLDFQSRFIEALTARPGIERVGFATQLPLAGPGWSSQFQARGWPSDRVGFEILHRAVDAGYFDALDIPLVRGRMLDARDHADAPFAVLINETFAREHFPNEDPIGQRIAYDRIATEDSRWYEIVGIVADQHQESPALPARAEVFEHRQQDWRRNAFYVMRTSLPATEAVASARAVLKEMDPLIAISQTRRLREVWRASMDREEFLLTLLGVFGAAALLLATVGVYAVTAQAARTRTREIGIRLALGADDARVVGLMLRQSLLVVAAGLLAGVVLTLLANRTLQSMLYGIAPGDPLTVAAVVALLAATSAAACWLPVRRALRSDPIRSLRSD